MWNIKVYGQHIMYIYLYFFFYQMDIMTEKKKKITTTEVEEYKKIKWIFHLQPKFSVFIDFSSAKVFFSFFYYNFLHDFLDTDFFLFHFIHPQINGAEGSYVWVHGNKVLKATTKKGFFWGYNWETVEMKFEEKFLASSMKGSLACFLCIPSQDMKS